MSDGDPTSDGPMGRWANSSPEALARRCTAHKKTGDQCGNPARHGGNVCDKHGGKAPQVVAKAKRRIEEAADRMANALLGIAEGAESEAVKLAAIRDALDRAGLKPKTGVEVAVGPIPAWQEIVTEVAVGGSRAESRAARGMPDLTAPAPPRWAPPALAAPADPDVVDAEIVPEGPENGPSGHGGPLPADGQGNAPSTPGNGLMTLEDAQAEIARANREAGVYPTKVRYSR